MMKTSAGGKGARDDSGPIGDTSEEGKEAHLCQATALRNCLRLPGISILDKLIKTCPIWLHLNMNQERAGVILGKETAGIFLVRKEGNMNNMVLAVRLPAQNEAPGVLEYNIKEEKSNSQEENKASPKEQAQVSIKCEELPFTGWKS